MLQNCTHKSWDLQINIATRECFASGVELILFKPELVEVCAIFNELVNQLDFQVIISLPRGAGLAALSVSLH